MLMLKIKNSFLVSIILLLLASAAAEKSGLDFFSFAATSWCFFLSRKKESKKE
jgi:hypothetical protein